MIKISIASQNGISNYQGSIKTNGLTGSGYALVPVGTVASFEDRFNQYIAPTNSSIINNYEEFKTTKNNLLLQIGNLNESKLSSANWLTEVGGASNLAAVIESVGTFATNNQAGGYYGVTISTDVAGTKYVSGFETGQLNGGGKDVDSFFRISADKFILGSAVAGGGTLAYPTDVVGSPIPAFIVEYDNDLGDYNIFFNGNVKFTYGDNAGETLIKGGYINTDLIQADQLILGANTSVRYWDAHASDSAVNTYITAQGATVREGDQYFNTTDSKQKIYQNGGWTFLQGSDGLDGDPGANGTNGERGTAYTFYNGTLTSTIATNLIVSITGTSPKTGDTIMWTNSSGSYVAKYSSGTWLLNTVMQVNGDAIINGTLSVDKLITGSAGGSFSALGFTSKVRVSGGSGNTGVSVDSKDYGITAEGSKIGGMFFNGLMVRGAASLPSTTLYPSGSNVALQVRTGSGTAMEVRNTTINTHSLGIKVHQSTTGIEATATSSYGINGISNGSSINSAIGVHGRANSSNGYGVYGGSSSGKGVVGQGATYGLYTAQQAYAAGGFFPFTAGHDCVTPDTKLIIGDIIGVIDSYAIDVSNMITTVVPTTQFADPSVYGVVVSSHDVAQLFQDNPLLYNTYGSPGDLGLNPILSPETGEWYYEHKGFIDSIINKVGTKCNAIGEGMINVCELGGDILIGSLICSSNLKGKGQKQTDTIVHSYTVAKAMKLVRWDQEIVGENGCYSLEGIKCKMIPCVYKI